LDTTQHQSFSSLSISATNLAAVGITEKPIVVSSGRR
jgi:hypothetical protein